MMRLEGWKSDEVDRGRAYLEARHLGSGRHHCGATRIARVEPHFSLV